MGWFHFFNCCALAYAPSFVIYKSTKLADYSALKACIYGGAAYALTQLLKLLLFATFIPDSPMALSNTSFFDYSQEIMKACIGILDIAGAYLVLGFASGSFEVRILAVALGWATSESLFVKLAPLWLGARELEFSWRHIQNAVEANINMLLVIAFFQIVGLWRSIVRRRNQTPRERSIGIVALAALLFYTIISVITAFLRVELEVTSWNIVLVQAGFAGWFVLLSYQLNRAYKKCKSE